MNLPSEFDEYRSRMNDVILKEENLTIRRFFNLDTNAYKEGALDVPTKEMLGLVSSMVLRCDDCIRYHLGKCKEAGISREQLFEVFSIGLVVAGSIVIPHMRRAVEYWDQL